MQPLVLEPNQPRHFYRGGASIASLRRVRAQDDFRPEDWVGSTTSRWGQGGTGLSRLPDGRLLVDAVSQDPRQWLGPEHEAYFGSDTALLVKFLDVGQRLPVHVHPSRRFAYQHLGSRHGKTECWLVLGVSGSEPSLYLGWSRDVENDEMSRWVKEQDARAMLANMNRIDAQPGMSVLVPAGTVHAIGAGIFCAELQEPTDFSVMLESAGFDFDMDEAQLGMDRDQALACASERAVRGRELEALQRANPSFTQAPPRGAAAADADEADLLVPQAKPYFRAQRLGQSRPGPVGPSFAVLIGTWGQGRLAGADWEVPVQQGSTLVVPWGAGPVSAHGDVEMIMCLPPKPQDAAQDDPAA